MNSRAKTPAQQGRWRELHAVTKDLYDLSLAVGSCLREVRVCTCPTCGHAEADLDEMEGLLALYAQLREDADAAFNALQDYELSLRS